MKAVERVKAHDVYVSRSEDIKRSPAQLWANVAERECKARRGLRVETLTGVDVWSAGIRWAAKNMRLRFRGRRVNQGAAQDCAVEQAVRNRNEHPTGVDLSHPSNEMNPQTNFGTVCTSTRRYSKRQVDQSVKQLED